MAILIVLVALGAGAWAAIRWVPPLASSRVGELVFWLVCGLVAVAAGVLVFGLYEALKQLGDNNGTEAAAAQLVGALKDAGILLGIAAGVHLLAGSRAGGGGASRGPA